MKTAFRPLLVTALTLPFLAGCEVGPDYVKPAAPVPAHYKDAGNWKPAHPRDAVVRGRWWEIYHDPELDALEEKVNISNQNVLLAEANFREAAAAVKVARAESFSHHHHEPDDHRIAVAEPEPFLVRQQ